MKLRGLVLHFSLKILLNVLPKKKKKDKSLKKKKPQNQGQSQDFELREATLTSSLAAS